MEVNDLKTKMPLDIFQKMMLSDDFNDLSGDLLIFDDEQCFFYYDESNNIRKLWLDENDFNAPIDSDFVLGGVMHFGENCIVDVNELRTQLRIQQSSKEIKFKHISKSTDFLGCLSENKVSFFLEWLLKSDLYVHYFNVNNLYYAIVDIIDSIVNPIYIPYVFQMKNELYKIAKDNYQSFYKHLISYNYPNIDSSKIKYFYDGIIDFVVNSDYELSFEAELLHQVLKSGREQTELIFLKENPDKTIIDSYFHIYMRPIGIFSNATHIFDDEYQIQEQFERFEIYNGDSICESFSFTDSKNNIYVQISDCIVGLLGKYFTYINSINMNEAHQMINNISLKQKKTLQLFASLISKSERKSKLLLGSCESIEEHDVSSAILVNAF